MTKKEARFIDAVLAFYKEHGRHTLPWRKTREPYKILVSEVMLQQTQVDRVLPKYTAFLKAFPTVSALASASLGDVLIVWQGLGYNRRAKMLYTCAQQVVSEYGGAFPKTHKELVALPGVGPYTASAILAFAFDKATPLIETNVRTVFLHHFYSDKEDVSDQDILKYVERTLPQQSVREWYWALMDYGSYIKKTVGNPNSKSRHYTKQTAFKGSDREIRGAIIRLLSGGKKTRVRVLRSLKHFEDVRVDAALHTLTEEGMIAKTKNTYQLP